jgi:hypothetical protein
MSTKRQSLGFDWTAWIQWVFLTTVGWLLGILITVQLDFLTDSRLGPILELGIGLTVGLVQWIQMRLLIPKSGWWILATGLAWSLSLAISRWLGAGFSLDLRGAMIGVLLGLSQWLLLRRYFRRAWWWIVTSALAWTLGQTLGESLVGAVVGGITGIALVMLVPNRWSRSETSG